MAHVIETENALPRSGRPSAFAHGSAEDTPFARGCHRARPPGIGAASLRDRAVAVATTEPASESAPTSITHWSRILHFDLLNEAETTMPSLPSTDTVHHRRRTGAGSDGLAWLRPLLSPAAILAAVQLALALLIVLLLLAVPDAVPGAASDAGDESATAASSARE